MHNQKMGKTLREDIRQGGFFRNLRREFKELQYFYLDDERREQLQQMGWFRRTFKSLIWLFKSLFFHLTPVRRLLFVIALVLLFTISANINGNNVEVQQNGSLVSLFILMFILMLELKDKLMAKKELRAGRAVQQALMPEEQPRVPGWQIYIYSDPANDVGGDLIDFFKIDNQQADIALGDVAGKGLPAALFMAKLQATLRAIAADYTKLEKLMTKVNEIFCRDSMSNSFASLVYIRIQEHSSPVRLVNAGHYPPILIQSGNIMELPKGNPAIGLNKNISFSETEFKLNPNDMLVIYSDGLSECMNSSKDFYGEERLKNLLEHVKENTPQQIAHSILNSVRNFAGDEPFADDLSFAILKYSAD